MILGIGVDIVDNLRIKRLLNLYGVRFLNRVFSREEVEYAFSRKHPEIHLAAAFATKEAVFKAIKSNTPFNPKEVFLVRTKTGAPEVKVLGKLQEEVSNRGVRALWVSVSHEKRYTVSMVVIEG